MTGWIKLTKIDGGPVYICVDHIQAVFEMPDDYDDPEVVTVLDMVTGAWNVKEDVETVLKKIKLARPERK